MNEKKASIMNKILIGFVFSLGIAVFGLYMGQYIPSKWIIPLMVIEFIMILAAFILRRKRMVRYSFVYIFVLISGVTTYPAVLYYGTENGANMVLGTFLLTLVLFILFALLGSVIKKDLGFLGGFLFIVLIGIILFYVVSLFITPSEFTSFIISIVSALLFSTYIIYDFNKIKKRNLKIRDVPHMVLNLYLDFVNLFLSLLRILNYMNRK